MAPIDPPADPPAVRLSCPPSVVFGSSCSDDGTAASSISEMVGPSFCSESQYSTGGRSDEAVLRHMDNVCDDADEELLEKKKTYYGGSARGQEEFAIAEVAMVSPDFLREPLLSAATGVPVDGPSNNYDFFSRSEPPSHRWAEVYCLVIGLIVGCFIQFSSLGANFLMTSLYGYSTLYTRQFILVSLTWCLVTSIMGVCVLLLLRSLVITAFYATLCFGDMGDSAAALQLKEQREQFMMAMIQRMEYSFAVGSLIGVCVSWTATDILLGMQAHILHSLFTLVVALLWCKAVMRFCADKKKKRFPGVEQHQPPPYVGV